MAIIVGCMPAFSQLWKMHVGGSALFRSLRSRFRGKSSFGSNTSADKEKNSSPEMAAWETPQVPGQRDSYEMSNTNLIKSQATSFENGPRTLGPSQDGIVRSVDISQHWQLENDSRECLE